MPCRAVPLVASLLLGGLWLHAQGGPPPLSPAVAAARAAQARETAEDHADMQRQLGILSMRPGPSGNPAAPDAANSDEATAMPFTDLPDPLRMQDGTPVTTRRAWARRRAADRDARGCDTRAPGDHVPGWRAARRPTGSTSTGRPAADATARG